MRYFFRGLSRDTGKAVEGNVEAPSVDDAYNILANNGIVTDQLQANPVPGPPAGPLPQSAPPSSTVYGIPLNQMNTQAPPPPAPAVNLPLGVAPPAPPRPMAAAPMAATTPAAAAGAPAAPAGANVPGMTPHLSNALDSALDQSASQIPFDALTEKFKGKQVWVIDRRKIRRQVAQVVDSALTQSLITAENTNETRARVAEAIEQLFGDTKKLATQRSAESIQAERAGTAPPAAMGKNIDLEEQIDRLASTVSRAEAVLASIAMAAQRIARGGGGGGGGGKRRSAQSVIDESQNEVLMEIFQSNLELRRQIREGVKEADKSAITINQTSSDSAAPAEVESSGDGIQEPQLTGAGATEPPPGSGGETQYE